MRRSRLLAGSAAAMLGSVVLSLDAGAAVRRFAVLRNGRVMEVTDVATQADGRVQLRLAPAGELLLPAALLLRVDEEGTEDVAAGPPPGPGASAAAPPVASPYDAALADAAGRHELDLRLVSAVARTESAMNPRAVSPKGAIGIMQLMPGTARDMGVSDPFDPLQNIDGGCRYLRLMLDRFQGNVRLAVAAYNAGPEPVARKGDVPDIQETKVYVERVLAAYVAR